MDKPAGPTPSSATRAAPRRGRSRDGAAATAADRTLTPRLKQAKLDLLPILHELLRTRSVTRAARALGITQPAASQALQRLRAAFGDDLLVSIGRDLQLTERAEALAAPLGGVLAEIDRLLRPARPFDPASEPLHVSIATADYATALLAPILAEVCAAEAPHVVFEFVSAGVRTADDLAGVDFLIGPRAFGRALGKRIGSLPLWQDEMVCIAPSGTALPSRITAETFRRSRQVAYLMNPRVPERIQAQLQPTSALETARVCTVPDFLVLGAIVEKADCVALVPRKVANQLARWHALRIIELVYANKHLAIDAYWSLAANGKRGHTWCRDLLARAASRVA